MQTATLNVVPSHTVNFLSANFGDSFQSLTYRTYFILTHPEDWYAHSLHAGNDLTVTVVLVVLSTAPFYAALCFLRRR